MKHIKNEKGESILETIVALLVMVMTFVFFSAAVVTASKWQSKAADSDGDFGAAGSPSGSVTVTVIAGGEHFVEQAELYRDGVYKYYEYTPPEE